MGDAPSLYVVTRKQGDAVWMEFYWADDLDHAQEQAVDNASEPEILCTAFVPYQPQPPVSEYVGELLVSVDATDEGAAATRLHELAGRLSDESGIRDVRVTRVD